MSRLPVSRAVLHNDPKRRRIGDLISEIGLPCRYCLLNHYFSVSRNILFGIHFCQSAAIDRSQVRFMSSRKVGHEMRMISKSGSMVNLGTRERKRKRRDCFP